jgi:hypothetical protein
VARRLRPFARALGAWLMGHDAEALGRFEAAAEDLDATLQAACADERLTGAEMERIKAGLEVLRDCAAAGGHAVLAIVDAINAAIGGWAEGRHQLTVRQEQERRRCRDLLAQGDEPELRRITDRIVEGGRQGAEFLQLGAAVSGELGRFWLRRLCFSEAARLRRATRAPGGEDLVPSPWAHFSPLIIGVSAGPLATIQLGSLTEALLKGRDWRYTLVVAMGFVISFLLLWGDLRRHSSGVSASRLLRRMVRPALALVVLSCALGGTMLVLLQGGGDFSLAAMLLWGSLSLFQGVFLGLIAQGRGSMNEG